MYHAFEKELNQIMAPHICHSLANLTYSLVGTNCGSNSLNHLFEKEVAPSSSVGLFIKQ
jgi:hypothetical protein